jgi:hypothetical protein
LYYYSSFEDIFQPFYFCNYALWTTLIAVVQFAEIISFAVPESDELFDWGRRKTVVNIIY